MYITRRYVYLGHTSAVSPPYLGYISAASPPYLHRITTVSWLHLGYISAVSRPYLGHISAARLILCDVARVEVSPELLPMAHLDVLCIDSLCMFRVAERIRVYT